MIEYSIFQFWLNIVLDKPFFYLIILVFFDLQSIIPGILQGDKSDSLLYGSVDNGKKICWDEKFHSKVIFLFVYVMPEVYLFHDSRAFMIISLFVLSLSL